MPVNPHDLVGETVDKRLDRLKAAIGELGYEAVVEDLLSPDLIGWEDDSILPTKDVLVVPGELADTDRPILPRSLIEAVGALKTSALFRGKMGSDFIDYIIALKEFEISRFLAHVTDWEHREYFEMF